MNIVNKEIKINASSSDVWKVLTVPDLIELWIGEPESKTEVKTSWKVGEYIFIDGIFHSMEYHNKGIVLEFNENKYLKYSYWSTLSQIPDITENYCITEFKLIEQEEDVLLNLIQSNFPTEVIYKHCNFYWNTVILRIKKLSEQLNQKFIEKSGIS